MQWLNELPFADNRVLQIGFLAACGIAALIVLAIFYRLAFAHRLRVPGGRTRQPRLGLVDAFSLDGQRQLVLVRRDNIEHLVMIGGPNDVLVESQINRAAAPARESNQVSPLLVPPTPARRTEAAAVAVSAAPEAPAKAAAKAPASPPAPPPAAPLPASPPAPVPARRPSCADRGGPSCANRGANDPEGARGANRSGFRPSIDSRPTICVRACSLGRRCADDASGGACPTGARKFAAASGGASSRTTARGNASADHSRQRLAEPWGSGSRYGNRSRARPGQFLGPVSCRACAAAPRGEIGAGGRRLEGGASRRGGENGAAYGVSRNRGAFGQRGRGSSAACAEDAGVGDAVRLGAKSSRRPPAGGQDGREERQAAGQSRRSLRRPRFARDRDGAPARPRKARLTQGRPGCGGR